MRFLSEKKFIIQYFKKQVNNHMRKTSLLLVYFCLFLHYSHAGLEEFFHKAKNKSEIHKIKNIDFIYMINLDERPEKFQQSAKELEPYGIYPYRFSAVNGWKLKYRIFNEVGLKFDSTMRKGYFGTTYRLHDEKIYPSHEMIEQEGTTYFAHLMSKGAIGIVLSHLSILQDAYDSGYQTIWVMEDDIEVLSNPHEISELIEKLDSLVDDWDILFTDIDTKDRAGNHVGCYGIYPRPNFVLKPSQYYLRRLPISQDFTQVGARYGAYSMIIRRSGMEKLLNFIKTYKIYLPYDIDYCYPPGIKLFSCTRDLVSHKPGSPSDNNNPGYIKRFSSN